MHPLRPGSQKEIALINYLDDKLLRITRRHAKKFSNERRDNDDTPGYTTYDEFATDIEPLIDIVWISGTPTIQIPYFLTLAGQICSYLEAFPFSTSFFPLAGKIDEGFASVLRAANNNSPGGSLPFNVSMTDKVRIKSLVEETRVAAVNAASASGYAASAPAISEIDSEDDDDDTDMGDDDITVRTDEELDVLPISLRLSRVYKQTLEILGDSLTSGSLPG
ncbi:hypothetical protein LTR84_005404 [Exophiala bonariae]|uniref:Uncharacterized protein n=1 Tax=Exophiala bonariae TaxID=1690606 RepID=A0AAV9N3P7_9EURO|nr:hypothetical protein LTR84_005404 [Exophiala bonariae]